MPIAAPSFTTWMRSRIVGLLMVIVGSLLGGKFIWSVPALVQRMKDEAPAGHLNLVILGAFFPALVGIAGGILVWLGLRLLRSRRGMHLGARRGAFG